MSTGISILGSQVLFGLHPAATPPPIDPPCCSFCVGSRLRQYKAQLSSCRGGTKTRKGQGGIHACLNCRNALESPGRAGATYRARLILLASRLALRPYVCNSAAATNVVFWRKRRLAMERMLTAFWDEDRQEIQLRRPSGQVFRFSARQAVAGGHEVFGVQVVGTEIWVLTGASGSRRPTWKAVHPDRHLSRHLGALTGFALDYGGESWT